MHRSLVLVVFLYHPRSSYFPLQIALPCCCCYKERCHGPRSFRYKQRCAMVLVFFVTNSVVPQSSSFSSFFNVVIVPRASPALVIQRPKVFSLFLLSFSLCTCEPEIARFHDCLWIFFLRLATISIGFLPLNSSINHGVRPSVRQR